MNSQQEELFKVLVLIAVAALLFWRRPWRASKTAFGTARWATRQMLRRTGMLGSHGLVLGRTLSLDAWLIRLPAYCHTLLVGSSGSGKGVSIILPQLLTYTRGSLICFDTKGDLFLICSSHRREGMGQRIIRLAPFNGGSDTFNPLYTIPADSPMLVDHARAMAEALVFRQGTEPDMHWVDKSVQAICAILVLVLLRFDGEERSLNTVQEIASDPEMVLGAAEKLHEMGGIPARLGSQLKTLFFKDEHQRFGLSKEGASVLSSVQKYLSFLDSTLVAASVAKSTFDARELLKPGTTLFLQIPPEQLLAARGLLRCWLSTLILVIGSAGDERNAEVLCLLDEASALNGLSAVEEALIRGRSAGVRLLLAYQSDSQVKAAFKDKPTLIYDNCSTQIYLGASSIESADRLSKSLGEWTQVVEQYSENDTTTWQGAGAPAQGAQVSRTRQHSWQPSARALLKPEEILTMPRDYLIALVDGLPPILARRVRYYSDPLNAVGILRPELYSRLLWWAVMAGAIALAAWAMMGGH